MDKVIFSTKDIPQADKLEKVIQTVEAVYEGASTDAKIAEAIGFTDRQARYYRSAAALLGFITNKLNNADVTPLGIKLANSEIDKKNILIRKAIVQNKLLRKVIEFFEKNKNGLTEIDVQNFILSIADNDADSTVPRRVKTILSWFEYSDIIFQLEDKYQFNETVDLDLEDKLPEESIYPANYSKEIDIKEEKFSVYELSRKIDQKKVFMNPDFQRNLVWKKFQKSKFIESIILNVPLPPLYFKKELDGKYIIIDGLQRTSALKAFIDKSNDNNFYLEGLEALPELNGKYFHQLEDDLRSRIEDKNLLIYILQPSVPMVVVYDIFNRINTGGTQLVRQEIRNCIFIGNATELLKKLSETDLFKTAIDYGISPVRMKDREAILRCLAFKIFNYNVDYNNSMDDYLERAMKKINRMSKREIEELENDFVRIMNLTVDFFGTDNFRLPTEYSRGRINIAVMESVYYFFSKKLDLYLISNKQKIKENYIKLFQNSHYIEAVRYSTGTTANVKSRFNLAQQILGDI